MADKIMALVGCQVQSCAEEVSYILDLVMMFHGKPVCQSCYEDGIADFNDDGEPKVDWHDLPPVKLSDLSE